MKRTLIKVTPPIFFAILVVVIVTVLGSHHKNKRVETASSLPFASRLQVESIIPVSMDVPPLSIQKQNNTYCNGRGPMLAPLEPREYGAVVIRNATQAEGLDAIARGQQRYNGSLDPAYLLSSRVIAHPDMAHVGMNVMAVIPKGMVLKPGQHIVYATSFAIPGYACHYFPNIVVRMDSAPAATAVTVVL